LIPVVIGGLLIIGAFYFRQLGERFTREGRAEAARKEQFPGQPWKWKKKWVGPAIEAGTGSGTLALWFFAIFWNAIAIPAAIIITLKPPADKVVYLVYLFPLIGAGLLGFAIYQTVRWRKYGRIRF